MKFDYKIIEKTEDYLKVSVELLKTMDCFNGHFNEVAIMPAVAQLYIVEKIAKQNFKHLDSFTGLQQVKFVGPICPDTQVIINIEFNQLKQQIAFDYHQGKIQKSKGKFNFLIRQDHE